RQSCLARPFPQNSGARVLRNVQDIGCSLRRAEGRIMIQHELALVTADAWQAADQLDRAVAVYLTPFTGSSRGHARSDLRCFLAWCAERHLSSAGGAPAAPGVVYPMDAGDPSLQAVHGLAPVLGRRGLLPDRRHRRRAGPLARRTCLATIRT